MEAAEVGNLGSTGFGANFKYRKVMIGVEVGRGWVFFLFVLFGFVSENIIVYMPQKRN